MFLYYAFAGCNILDTTLSRLAMSVPLTFFLTFLVTSLLSSVITYLCITKKTKRPPKAHCEYFTRTESDAIYDTVSVNPSGGNVFEMKDNEA